MRAIIVNRDIEAPTQAVWDVLADFPNIADWNGGVKKSYATSEETAGVGATRHLDLAPAGGVEETIREWAPLERMVISIDSASKVPFSQGRATFSLSATDEAATHVPDDVRIRAEMGHPGHADSSHPRSAIHQGVQRVPQRP